jgi:hypothetical protein
MHAPTIGSHVEPLGHVPQPVWPHVPFVGTQTMTWFPAASEVVRQLSPPAQSAGPVQVWPQKSLPAYCTQLAGAGQSLALTHGVQVAEPVPPPAPLPPVPPSSTPGGDEQQMKIS